MSKRKATLRILIGVKELLADETRWTAGAWARHGDGEKCMPCSARAVCWCLGGALMKVGASDPLAMIDARDILSKMVACERCDLTLFNDDHGHAAVLNLLAHAIAAQSPVPQAPA